MKLRIKYIYESGGDAAALERVITSGDITSMLTQAEYSQQVHEYDRKQLQAYAETVQEIEDLQNTLEKDMSKLENLESDYAEQQETLNTTISSKQDEISNLDGMLQDAARKVLEEQQRQQEAEQQAQSEQAGTGSSSAEVQNSSSETESDSENTQGGGSTQSGGSTQGGGSGSGKTRFFIKPSLMQCTSKKYPTSFIVTDPKGTLLVECGQMLVDEGYTVKSLNTINFSKSMRYNPFMYIRSEKDILKLVNTIIANTKGEGEKSNEDFWVKAERLYYCALIGYIWYEAPVEEQNFNTLLEFINASETREDDENFKNAVDLLFEALEQKKPEQ